jgi:hypothetical protein
MRQEQQGESGCEHLHRQFMAGLEMGEYRPDVQSYLRDLAKQMADVYLELGIMQIEEIASIMTKKGMTQKWYEKADRALSLTIQFYESAKADGIVLEAECLQEGEVDFHLPIKGGLLYGIQDPASRFGDSSIVFNEHNEDICEGEVLQDYVSPSGLVLLLVKSSSVYAVYDETGKSIYYAPTKIEAHEVNGEYVFATQKHKGAWELVSEKGELLFQELETIESFGIDESGLRLVGTKKDKDGKSIGVIYENGEERVREKESRDDRGVFLKSGEEMCLLRDYKKSGQERRLEYYKDDTQKFSMEIRDDFLEFKALFDDGAGGFMVLTQAETSDGNELSFSFSIGRGIEVVEGKYLKSLQVGHSFLCVGLHDRGGYRVYNENGIVEFDFKVEPELIVVGDKILITSFGEKTAILYKEGESQNLYFDMKDGVRINEAILHEGRIYVVVEGKEGAGSSRLYDLETKLPIMKESFISATKLSGHNGKLVLKCLGFGGKSGVSIVYDGKEIAHFEGTTSDAIQFEPGVLAITEEQKSETGEGTIMKRHEVRLP